jgi:hypothetical protein
MLHRIGRPDETLSGKSRTGRYPGRKNPKPGQALRLIIDV